MQSPYRQPPSRLLAGLLLLLVCATAPLPAQEPPRQPAPPPADGFFPPGGPPGFGPGGPGQERALVARFDRDGDQRLNAEERTAARAFLREQPAPGGPGGRPFGGFGGFGGRREDAAPPVAGRRLSPADVPVQTTPFYDPGTLRTLFLEFTAPDWEQELADFNNTDVEVPAQLTVDGKTYADVGVHFRGASSFMGVGAGRKRSLNVSLDFVHEGQNVGGYRTLNLLNAHEDPSFLRTVLYHHIAREYLPAPKANFVHVVINGESWGVYVSAQQFNKDFTREAFGSTRGARWKVPGSPQARGSLAYLGDDPAPYRTIYELKTKEDARSWSRLITLCRVLNQTPPAELEAALAPLLDIDGALRFLALENVLINNDGYWVRTSDYSLYLDEQNRFHVIPHDANETFSPALMMGGPGMMGGGPGGFMGPPPPLLQALDQDRNGTIDAAEIDRAAASLATLDQNRNGRLEAEELLPSGPGFGGPGLPPGGRPPGGPGFGGGGPGGGRGGNVELDPLIAANDPNKPLLSKLLAVPALRQRYLGHVRDIAERWLDWDRLGPVAARYHALIDAEVKADTRKLDTYDAFVAGLAGNRTGSGRGENPAERGPRPRLSLKDFAAQRRAYLLQLPAVPAAPAPTGAR